jgi:hypothetical protein
MRLFRSSLIGVALITLASCSSPKEASVAPPSPPVEKAAPTAGQAEGSGFTALQNVISKTKTAVEAGKFDQAKTEFGKFEDSWKTVEDGVKAKASKTYDAIEEGMDSVNNGLKSKNKEASLTALQALSKNVASVAK